MLAPRIFKRFSELLDIAVSRGAAAWLRLNTDGTVTERSASETRTDLGLGSLATQNGTFSGTSSGTNTGDDAVNSLYSGLVSNATHTGDATGATALTLATVNSNVGSFAIATITVNGKGLVTAASAAATLGTGSVILSSGTINSTAGQTYTLPSTTSTLARTDAAQTFTGTQTFSGQITYGSLVGANSTSGITIGQFGTVSINGDVILKRFAAREWQFGASNDAGSYILRCGVASGTNIAAGNMTLIAGTATGNASGGSLIFQTSAVGSSGATAQTATTRLTINSLGEIIPILPTSSAGLTTGALWNDSGTVKVA